MSAQLITSLLAATLLTSGVSGQSWPASITQDCAIAKILWEKMGLSGFLSGYCCGQRGISCSARRIITLEWQHRGLKNSIPPEIGNLTDLTMVRFSWNQLTGPIPPEISNLKKLQELTLGVNKLSGTIPPSLGSMAQLKWLSLQGNQLSGDIPSALGSLTQLNALWLYDNQLSGFPSSLLSLTGNIKYFPNPMSQIPYDAVKTASAGTLSNVTWAPFWSATVSSLTKRQLTSVAASISTEELIKMCPLNNVKGADVASGCVAGIYSKFCYNPSDAKLQAQCHDAYNRAFAASFFKPLSDVCPAWRRGPRSASCATAIKAFKYSYFIGKDAAGRPVNLELNSVHANELVSNIFANPTFAPCRAPAVCQWSVTRA